MRSPNNYANKDKKQAEQTNNKTLCRTQEEGYKSSVSQS